MSNQEKMNALMTYLKDQDIEFWVEVPSSRGVLPLYIPKHAIAVQIGDNEEWYSQLKNFVHPVFIRESDSVDFVIEKVANTIKRFSSAQKKAKNTKKVSTKAPSQSNLNRSQRKWRELNARIRQRRTAFLKSLKPVSVSQETSEPPTDTPKRKRPRISATPIKIGVL